MMLSNSMTYNPSHADSTLRELNRYLLSTALYVDDGPNQHPHSNNKLLLLTKRTK